MTLRADKHCAAAKPRHAQKENKLPQSRRFTARQLPLRGSLKRPTRFRKAVPLKMRRNFRNRKIASVPVKGPAFSDPKGTSRPSAEGKVGGEGKAGQPLGSRGRDPRASLVPFSA